MNNKIDFIYPLNEKYTEILRLEQILIIENMPYILTRFMDGWRIGIYNEKNGKEITDCVQHKYSHGAEDNKLESWNNNCAGWETAEEVLEYFKAMYKSNQGKEEQRANRLIME